MAALAPLAAPLIAALIQEIPVAVQGLMGIINAIRDHGLTDQEARAKLDELSLQIGAGLVVAKDLAARIVKG